MMIDETMVKIKIEKEIGLHTDNMKKHEREDKPEEKERQRQEKARQREGKNPTLCLHVVVGDNEDPQCFVPTNNPRNSTVQEMKKVKRKKQSHMTSRTNQHGASVQSKGMRSRTRPKRTSG